MPVCAGQVGELAAFSIKNRIPSRRKIKEKASHSKSPNRQHAQQMIYMQPPSLDQRELPSDRILRRNVGVKDSKNNVALN
jgi:hypothetical protein